MAQVVPPDKVAELEEALGQESEEVSLTINRKQQEVTVTPFRLRQFVSALRCVQRLREAGVVEDKALKKAAEAGSAAEAVKGFDMVKMFLNGGEELLNIIKIAVPLQTQAVDNLDIPDGVKLAAAVFRVNLDFFYRNRQMIQDALAPAVEAIEQVMSEGVESLGQPPLTDLEEQVTH